MQLNSKPESELIAASRQGDLAAFNALVELYQVPVFNLCLRLLGAHMPAEDATQETFLAAFRAISGFRGGSFRAWLFRIATNACYDELRRRRPLSLDARQETFGESVDVADPADSPLDIAERQETSRLVQAALLELPADQRAAVVMCDLHGFSYEEIAQATGASLGTVKSRIARGRARLRDIIRQRELSGR